MKKLLLILLLIPSALSAVTQETKELFHQANEAYSGGEFRQASELYLQLYDQGYHSAELYYNLGNAFYKTGKFPQAILYYEKALKLDPSNEDTRYNLKLANLRIADKIEPLPELLITQWWKSLVFSRNSDSWGWFGITAFFIAAVLLSLFIAARKTFLKKLSFYSGVVMILAGFLFLTLAYQQKRFIENNTYAIVFAPSLTVRSAPDKSGNKVFVVHEGTRVQVLETLSDWKKIGLANGNVGWVKSDALERI